tara:strand:+ start:1027 stop:1251 length:225 start_codon:yes stop_codon:yes gene_type:complete
MKLECKICGNPTECSEDAVKITCSHCVVQMATYFINRKAGLFYEIKEPTDWEARVSSSIELEKLKKVENNEKKA